MTPRMFRGVFVLATLCLATACSQPPNRVVARDPIPPPRPGYRVVCESHPFIFNAYIGECREVPIRTETRTVVRAKG